MWQRLRHRLPVALACLVLAACSAGGPGFGNDAHGGNGDATNDGTVNNGDGTGSTDDVVVIRRDTGTGSTDDGGTVGDDVIASQDGGGIYDDVPPGSDVMTGCNPDMCNPAPLGCLAQEVCDNGMDTSGNGVDDDCDGMVDEGCVCVPGQVQRCFNGPPGHRGIGACQDGMQTCQGSSEFGQWGACQGGIAPSGEVCDSLDNDCNGCADDNLCCTSAGTCPAPGDPRIPTGTPFNPVTLHGNDFLAGATRYAWHIEGGPCDQMLYATSQNVSFTLNGNTNTDTLDATGETFVFHPTLSGDYTVTLTITRTDGTMLTCTFIVPVRAPGFRVELCWDTTGTDDIDLWLHQPNNQADWPSDLGFSGSPPSEDCYYLNCRNGDRAGGSPFGGDPDWGYSPTPGNGCREPASGGCYNPRLDVDNIGTPGIPENINVDAPRNHDRFRIAANYYGGSDHTVHPMVNIYCGGALRATYGGADAAGMHFGATPVTGFNRSGQDSSGSVWRVADVSMTEPGDSCDVIALHPGTNTAPQPGYCVATNTNRSFAGSCTAAQP